METRIMFLIFALLAVYLVFSPKGRNLIKQYAGVSIAEK
jgi:hypothetical protein